MARDTTDASPYSPWMVSRGEMVCDGSAVAGLKLSSSEKQALMAAFLIGRRQGAIAKFGALGQLARRFSPEGSLERLADAYVAAGKGQMDVAVSCIRMMQIGNRADASRRNEAATRLKALARFVPAKHPV